MKRTKSPYLVLMAAVLMVGTVQESRADLLMNITDAGGGNTRFVFSGSATVTSGSQAYNGIWIHPLFAGGGWAAGASLSQSIISGSGTSSSTGSSGGSIFDVYTDLNFGFAPRDTNVRQFTGDVISWSGDLISSTPFSDFVSGVYIGNVIGTAGGASRLITLDSNYILTIGVAVPEPGTLGLLGLGLAGMGLARRRRKV